MTLREVVTHGGTDRGYKFCRCHDCGRESVCEPMDDYYTKPGADEGPLYCESCIIKTVLEVAPLSSRIGAGG